MRQRVRLSSTLPHVADEASLRRRAITRAITRSGRRGEWRRAIALLDALERRHAPSCPSARARPLSSPAIGPAAAAASAAPRWARPRDTRKTVLRAGRVHVHDGAAVFGARESAGRRRRALRGGRGPRPRRRRPREGRRSCRVARSSRFAEARSCPHRGHGWLGGVRTTTDGVAATLAAPLRRAERRSVPRRRRRSGDAGARGRPGRRGDVGDDAVFLGMSCSKRATRACTSRRAPKNC